MNILSVNHNIRKLILNKCNKFILAFFVKNKIEFEYAINLLVLRIEPVICTSHKNIYTAHICIKCNKYTEKCKDCDRKCSICLETNICSTCIKHCCRPWCVLEICIKCKQKINTNSCVEHIMEFIVLDYNDECYVCKSTSYIHMYLCKYCKKYICQDCVTNRKFNYLNHLDKCSLL